MSRPWMPLYVADYRADTAHLSAIEHGAYLLLIMHYWQTGGLPKEDQQLARIACMTSGEWRRARSVISAFFDVDWRHGRIEFELTEAARIQAAARKGGEASARAKRERSANGAPTTVERPLNDRTNDHGNDRPTNGQPLPSPSPRKEDAADAAPRLPIEDAETDYFRRGKAILGKNAGGLLVNLLKAKASKVPLARAVLEQASVKENPREYINAAIRGPPKILGFDGQPFPDGIT